MTALLLPTPPPVVPLNDVVSAIRDRWIVPATPGVCRVEPSRFDALAGQVLDAMLTRQFRVTALPEKVEYDVLLKKVRHWVGRGQPIRVRIGYAPMKNLNTARVSRADWAEFFALTHLCAWHNKVQAIYPPGLRLSIVFDDSTILMANRHDFAQMRSYMDSVWRLVREMGYDGFTAGTLRQSSFAWLFHLGAYQIAAWRVRRWEADPANRGVIERMDDFARRNVTLPPGLSEAERERQIREASHRYRVYWEALQWSGISRIGHALIAMYLDGHQHHIRQPAAFHLTTLGKGQVAQPWQGEGGLCDNGHGQWLPCVLTAGRREQLAMTELSGLDIIPLPGFESIQLCRKTGERGQ